MFYSLSSFHWHPSQESGSRRACGTRRHVSPLFQRRRAPRGAGRPARGSCAPERLGATAPLATCGRPWMELPATLESWDVLIPKDAPIRLAGLDLGARGDVSAGIVALCAARLDGSGGVGTPPPDRFIACRRRSVDAVQCVGGGHPSLDRRLCRSDGCLS